MSTATAVLVELAAHVDAVLYRDYHLMKYSSKHQINNNRMMMTMILSIHPIQMLLQLAAILAIHF
jgi:hypothetical protein